MVSMLSVMSGISTVGQAVKPRLRGVLHQWAFFVSLVAGAALVVIAPAGRATFATAVYALTVAGLFGVSAIYHRVNWVSVTARRWMRRLDHSMIFLLIAGTYTPFVLIALRGAWGWSLFGTVWVLATLGALFELSRWRHARGVRVALYIAIGWVGLVAIKPMVAALPVPGLWLLFGGGVSYTFGVLFYVRRSLRYHHAVWHMFVLGGSVLHYFAVLWYVLPKT